MRSKSSDGENHGKRSRPRDWKTYNRFRRDEYSRVLPIIASVVGSVESPYKVKDDGTVGRPPADPRAMVICLLIRAIFGLSYYPVYSVLEPLASTGSFRRLYEKPAATPSDRTHGEW